tara:strand:+ start:2766 stop:3407 length:642 start_codon:yes stop_codon:yes gene_type:complete
MVEQRPRRQTAYKVWINDLHTAELVVNPETEMSFLDVKGKNVVRVNIFGSVIDSLKNEDYGTLVIDDSSGALRMRVWGEDLYLFEDVNVGDLIFVIGRWAVFNDERYLRPEIVRKVEMDWALLRRLELTKEFGSPKKEEKVSVSAEESEVKEVEPSLSAREAVLVLIEKHDSVNDEQLTAESGLTPENLKIAIMDLLKEGEIFSPEKGVYQLV